MEHLEVQGFAIPKLGFGTWELTGDECYDAVRHALELGYRHIDTAQAYGNESEVGRAIADSGVDRDDLWVTTKIWRTNLRPDDVRRSTERSLQELGLDQVDLLLIHWPSDEVPLEQTLAAMDDLREAGRTRAIGVSNFTPTLVEEALGLAPILCDQVEYHPYLAQTELRDLCVQNDLMLTAYSPLAKGRVPGDETLEEIGDAHGRSAAQVVLRWLLQQDNVVAIPRSSSADHREANLDVFDLELSDDEIGRIDDLAGGRRLIDPAFGPDWEA
ncbi:MAG: aldo/keto reductase [Actinobacteria bacterium]|nr:aldo/keto reductase [Actinomycetota bacterium]